MRKFCIALFCGALGVTSTATLAQNAVRMRGAITAFDGSTLSIKSVESGEVRMELARDAVVLTTKALELADLTPGAGLGVTAFKRADGKLVASRVNVFPASRGVPNEGHRPMSEPGATMTNAMVSAVVQGTSGRELTLSYNGGRQQVVVPENVPVFTSIDADRSLLVPGESVVVTATVNADGKVVASRVQLSREVARP